VDAKVTCEESSPQRVTSSAAFDVAIRQADVEAKARGLLNVIFIEVPAGHILGMVVGGDESALTFTYNHRNPPYLESVGPVQDSDPILTCYVSYTHPTELPRRCVISFPAAFRAAQEFVTSGNLPASVQWAET
jgi:hypothetical protein